MTDTAKDHRQTSFETEAAYIHHLLAFILREEAEASPFIAPWIETVISSSGKMLRPRLVVTGARIGSALAAGSPNSAAVMSDANRPADRALTAPDKNGGTQTDFDTSQLESLRDHLKTRISGGTVPLAPVPAFAQWKNSIPFSGALQNRVYLLSASVEMLHLASLAHDDVIDESSVRRGKPSAPALLGPSGAVLAGDLLFTLCFSLANEGAAGSVAQTLAAMVRLMVRSELLQAEQRRSFDGYISGSIQLPGRRSYLRTIGGKTALLFSMSLTTGAAETGAANDVLKNLQIFGFLLGLVFQIKDDILDLTADERQSGKKPGQDIRDSQITLPLIYGLQNDTTKKLASAVNSFRSGQTDLNTVLAILTEGGALARCRKEIETLSARAQNSLQALKRLGLPQTHISELANLLAFAAERIQ